MVSKAIVSSIYINPWDSQIYYLFDVEINSGFSGGPIIDHEGNLIAITSHGSNVEGVSWTWGVPSLSLVDLFENGKQNICIYQCFQGVMSHIVVLLKKSSSGTAPLFPKTLTQNLNMI